MAIRFKSNPVAGILTALLFSQLFSSCGLIRNMLPASRYTEIKVTPDSVYYTPMIWSYDTVDGSSVRKSALYLPVYVDCIGQSALMQMDLGANQSGFYLKTLELFTDSFPELRNSIITTPKGGVCLKNAVLTLNDGVSLHKDLFHVWKNMGHDSMPSTTPVIGTIGYDILDDYILIIDYLNNRVALTCSLPGTLEEKITYIQNADLKKFPVLLPFRLGKRKIRLMFDTGSGSSEILTSTRRLKKTAVNREIVPIDSGYSWGKPYYEYVALEPESGYTDLYIGDIWLGEVRITGADMLNRAMSLAGRFLYGITGNEIFQCSIIIIDRKNNRFGIVSK